MTPFANLNRREQLWLTAGALISLTLLFILLVWRPLNTANMQLQKSLQTKENLLSWMQAVADEVQQFKAAGIDIAPGQPLPERTQQLVRELGLNADPPRSSNDGSLELRFEQVEFNRLLTLLDRSSRDGAILQNLSLQALPQSGYVSARLTLTD